ncbi:MAG: 50S ribosomal protein L19e [Candidatus Woesearchaeota archaeon]
MNLTLQKRLASQIMNCGLDRIRFDTGSLEQIKEAITNKDVKGLIKKGLITRAPEKGISRYRAILRIEQRKKGRRRGHGTRKGTYGARMRDKEKWMGKVRLQRSTLRELKESKKVNQEEYRELYMKVKGGFFRSKRHMMLYIEERGLKK